MGKIAWEATKWMRVFIMSVSESWLLSIKHYYNPVAKDKVVPSILMGKPFKQILTSDQYVKLMIK